MEVSDANFYEIVHIVLNDEFNLGLTKETQIRVGGVNHKYDFADTKKQVFVKIIKDFRSNIRGDIGREMSSNITLLTKIYKNAKLFFIVKSKFSKKDREYFEELFYKGAVRQNITFYDTDDITNLEKKHSNSTNLNPKTESVLIPRQFNFPKIEITSNERYWLELVFDKFLKSEEFEVRHLLAKEWARFTNGFDPFKINFLLLGNGKNITLLGIWQIKSDSDIFEKFDKTISAIQNIIKTGESVTSINSTQLSNILPNISRDEMGNIFKLIADFNGFSNGYGFNSETKVYTITINTDSIYKRYLNYQGLEYLMHEHISRSQENAGNKITSDVEQSTLSDIIEKDAFAHARIDLKIQDSKDLTGILNVDEISNEVWALIDNMPNEKGIFGIFGRWGRGKSFLIRKVIDRINMDNNKKECQKKHIIIEFDSWKYQDTPASWAYLYQTIVEKFISQSRYLTFFGFKLLNKDIFELNLHKYSSLRIIIFIISLFFPLLLLLSNFEDTPEILTYFYSIFGTIGLVYLYKFYTRQLPKAIDLFKQYNTVASFKHLLGFQSEIQEEIVQLITHWIQDPKKKNIVLIVENLDRCDETKMLALIDSIRIILEESPIAERMKIIAAVDESLITACIENKYRNIFKELKKKNASQEFSVQYLDKVFIAGIRLNSLTPEDNGDMILALAKNDLKRNDMSISTMKDQLNKLYNIEVNETKETNNLLSDELILSDDSQEVKSATYTDSKTKSGPPRSDEQTLNKNPGEPQTPDLGFSLNEIKLLYEASKKFISLTPRKIRIIYYRYYLAKNLLFALYDENKNIWRNPDHSEILIYLLFKFSINKKELGSIDIKKISVIESNDGYVKIPDSEVKIKKEDYIRLLNVLELVIIF